MGLFDEKHPDASLGAFVWAQLSMLGSALAQRSRDLDELHLGALTPGVKKRWRAKAFFRTGWVGANLIVVSLGALSREVPPERDFEAFVHTFVCTDLHERLHRHFWKEGVARGFTPDGMPLDEPHVTYVEHVTAAHMGLRARLGLPWHRAAFWRDNAAREGRSLNGPSRATA